jgi:hypothetical protein
MTRRELCEELQAPAETPPGPLAAAWERRRSDLLAAASADGNAKPVKMRLRRELSRLDEGAAIARQLRVAADIARYLDDAEAEWAGPAPRRSVIRLCLDRARPLFADLADPELRYDWEKRLAAEDERLAAEPPAPRGPALGTVLDLIPARPRAAQPAVRMVARPTFTLGRQAAADLTTRFGPETEENRRRTSTISRINTTLFMRGGQIYAQDGGIEPDGNRRPSRNGTVADDQRLTGEIPLGFDREHRLKLGQYFFEVSAVRLEGCARFLPVSSPAAPIAGVWVFSEATLGSSADAAVVLECRVPPVAARIQYRDAEFWLSVAQGGDGVVTLDRRSCAAGEVVPLQAAHELRVGDALYTLQLR